MSEAVLSDAELLTLAWNTISDFEDAVNNIRDFARALDLIGRGMSQPESGAIRRLARSIEEMVDVIEEKRGKLFYALHPRRREPDFPPDDGNGDEPAAT